MDSSPLLSLLTLLLAALLGPAAGQVAGQGEGGSSSITSTAPSGSGQRLVFTTIEFEPYLMRSTNKDARGNERFTGFIADLVREVAKRLDVEYELRLVRDEKWGSRDQYTGKWNGMIGEIISGTADLTAAPLTVNNVRKTVVDFSMPWQDVWLTALVKSGQHHQSLEDLLNANFTFGSLEGGSTSQTLRQSRNQKYSVLWPMVSNNLVADNAEGERRVKQGKFALIMEKPSAEYLVAQDCGYQAVDKFLQQAGYAFAVKKNNALLNQVNNALMAIKRDGIVMELQNQYWQQQECSGAAQGVVSALLVALGVFFTRFLL